MRERLYETLDATFESDHDNGLVDNQLRLARVEDGSIRLVGRGGAFTLDKSNAEQLYAQLGEALGKTSFTGWQRWPGYPYLTWCSTATATNTGNSK